MPSGKSKSKSDAKRAPGFSVYEAENLPPCEQSLVWSFIAFAKARNALRSGKAICMTVEPSRMLSMWRYFQSRIGIPVSVRFEVRRQRVWIYGAHRLRRARHPATPPTRPVLSMAWRGKLRDDALVRVIVADAGAWVEQAASDWTFRNALASFVATRGDQYALEFDVDRLESWINRAERDALIEPYADTSGGQSA